MTYVGIAKDVEARLEQHNGNTKGGAKSTRSARPWKIARTLGPFDGRAKAQSVEYQIKQQSGTARIAGSDDSPLPSN